MEDRTEIRRKMKKEFTDILLSNQAIKVTKMNYVEEIIKSICEWAQRDLSTTDIYNKEHTVDMVKALTGLIEANEESKRATIKTHSMFAACADVENSVLKRE